MTTWWVHFSSVIQRQMQAEILQMKNMREFCTVCDLITSITNGRCMAGFMLSKM